MAVDMFLKIDGIDGESEDAAHTDVCQRGSSNEGLFSLVWQQPPTRSAVAGQEDSQGEPSGQYSTGPLA